MSVKLLSVGAASTSGGKTARGSERVSITNEALATLQELPQTPQNWVTIWGPARCGKSFFLNCLAKSDGGSHIFPISSEFLACTTGADLSKTTLELKEFLDEPGAVGKGGDLASAFTPSPAIGFVDVEGQGDRHLSHEIMLATPLLLLSKVVIFNWMGRPNKTTILDRLATMREAAMFVNEWQRGNAFGHLILLLRDVPNGEEQAHAVVFGEENPERASSQEEEQHMVARNKTRDLLQQSFQTIRTVCMPQPHADINAHTGGNVVREIGPDEVDSTFAAKLSGLREKLSSILSEPHRFGGEPILGGPVLVSLLSEVCERVNQGAKDIVPLSMMESIHQKQVQAACQEATSIFKGMITCLEDGPVKSKATTAHIVEESMATASNTFTDGTQWLDEEVVTKAFKGLKAALHEKAAACYLRQEYQVTEAKVKLGKLVVARHREIEFQGLDAIVAKLPISKDGGLYDLWGHMCGVAYHDLERSIREEISSDLFEDLEADMPTLATFKEGMKGMLERLMGINRSMIIVKEENEARLRSEAERMQQERQKDRDRAQQDREAWQEELQKHEARRRDEIERMRHEREEDQNRARQERYALQEELERYGREILQKQRREHEADQQRLGRKVQVVEEAKTTAERSQPGWIESLSAGLGAFVYNVSGGGGRDQQIHHQSGAVDVEVGPIWNHAHAKEVARQYEQDNPGTRWNGQWKTTAPNQSVIGIERDHP